jgi:Ca2+-binding EF-hand superfamily protein
MFRITIVLLPALAILLGPAPARSHEPASRAPEHETLFVLTGGAPLILRLEVELDMWDCHAVWRRYVENAFAELDANADGELTPDESGSAAAAWRLAVIGGNVYRSRASGVSTADAWPHDGKVTPDELADFFRAVDAGPVRLIAGVPAAPRRRPGARSVPPQAGLALQQHLDLDRDGHLSDEELRSAWRSLRKLDRNSDAMIDAAELFSATRFAGAMSRREKSLIRLVAEGSERALAAELLARYDGGEGEPDGKLSPRELGFAGELLQPFDEDGDGQLADGELRRFAADPPYSVHLRVRLGNRWVGASPVEVVDVPDGRVAVTAERELVRITRGRDSLELLAATAPPSDLTQAKLRFAAADRDKNGYLDRTESRRLDLARIFDSLDDGDEKMFLGEFLAMSEQQGEFARTRVAITAAEHDGDLFQAFDADGDGRLGEREVRNARLLFSKENRGAGPLSGGLVLRIGFASPSGTPSVPIPIAASRAERAFQSQGPLWFQHMDRNGDGDVSRREFLGRLEQFKELDADRDGLLAPGEAVWIATAQRLSAGAAAKEDGRRRGLEPGDGRAAMAERIDAHIFGALVASGVVAAPPSDDAEFFRRIWLDIAGTIPPAAEVRDFLRDDHVEKRRRAVEQLLDSPEYVNHFADVWRFALIPEAAADSRLRNLDPPLEGWLRQRLIENTPYDELVRELLTAPLDSQAAATLSPAAFFLAKQRAPEKLAASASRVFLGVRLECAQCHDHPFDDWTRQQFWQFAAFFAEVAPPSPVKAPNSIGASSRRRIAIPDTDQVVEAVFLDGARPEPVRSPRAELAGWITDGDNPYFARAAVNRLWAHFFGAGLVEPPDDFAPANPASHPELLAELAEDFADHGFDLKHLIRAITASRAYQLSSAGGDADGSPQQFARMAVKPLSPEQRWASLVQATGYPPLIWRTTPRSSARRSNPEFEFRQQFAGGAGAAIEQEMSVPQTLLLMNGPLTTLAVDPEQGRTLAAVIAFPLTPREQIKALYLATLSRPPRQDEWEGLELYVLDGGPRGDPDLALSDVFWALLNSAEFGTNH